MKKLIRKIIAWFEAPIEVGLMLKEEEERRQEREKGGNQCQSR